MAVKYVTAFSVFLFRSFTNIMHRLVAQIVISTPNHDWAREVTEAEGTLAAYLSSTVSAPSAVSAPGEASGEQKPPKPALTATPAPGVFDTRADLARLTRVSIHNGLYPSVSQDGAKETVLVFPDFKAVTEVAVSEEGTQEVFERVLSPSVPLQAVPPARTGSDSRAGIKTWFLRYSCVILICRRSSLLGRLDDPLMCGRRQARIRSATTAVGPPRRRSTTVGPHTPPDSSLCFCLP